MRTLGIALQVIGLILAVSGVIVIFGGGEARANGVVELVFAAVLSFGGRRLSTRALT